MVEATADRVRTDRWRSLETWRSTAFLAGGVLLAVDAVVVAATIVTGAERFLLLGQAFVGAGWTAALVGLLGLYPGLAEPSRRLARVGAVCAAVGAVTFTVVAAASLAYYAGIPDGEYGAIGMFFIPGVLVGSVLGFVSFSAASLRTDVYSRTVGVLLLVPPLFVLANILRFVAGMESTTLTLAIVVLDALAMLAIGTRLRNEAAPTDRAEPASTEAGHD